MLRHSISSLADTRTLTLDLIGPLHPSINAKTYAVFDITLRDEP